MKGSEKKKEVQLIMSKIKDQFERKFNSIILCTYRKNFIPLLTENESIHRYVQGCMGSDDKESKVFSSTDAGWGCTIRVGQMMICQALMRHYFGYNQIDNIAKIGFCHDKFPGEWYGPHAISLMLKDLNKVYQPVDRFQICMFHDGTIYYDKIKKMAVRDGKAYQLRNFIRKHHSEEKQKVRAKIEFIFQKYLREIGYFKEFPITRAKHHDGNKGFGSPKRTTTTIEEEKKKQDDDHEYKEKIEMIINDNELLKSNWRNSILVIIPSRLGLNKINKEYFVAIQKFFQFRQNVGIIGGRPQQALYFVGTQKSDLICLDPHFVQDTVPSNEHLEEEFNTYIPQQSKKISMNKIDTSLAFGFLLRDYQDFEDFQAFIQEGKYTYKDNWLFSIFDKKPDLYSQHSNEFSNNFYLPKTTLGFEDIKSAQVRKQTQIKQQQQPSSSSLSVQPLPIIRNNSTQNPKVNQIKADENIDQDEFELI